MQATVSTESIETKSLSVVSICVLIFFALSDAQVLGAITPQIAIGLGVDKAAIAFSVTVYAVAAAAVAILLGNLHLFPRLKDVLSLPLAATLFSAATALAALSPNYRIFLLSRGLAGLAGGLISALTISALANSSSYSKRGKQMIGPSICYFLAPVLGVPCATYLVTHSGWRMSFALLSILTLLAGAMVYRFSIKQSLKDGQTSGVIRLVFSDRARVAGVAGAFFVSGGLVGFTTYLGTWLSDSFHAGLNQIGLIYGLAGTIAVLAGATGGAFADRFGKKAVALKGSLGMVVALLFLPTFGWGGGLFILISLTAFFAAIRVAPLQALVTEQVESADRAAYIAIRNSFSQLGIASAVALGALLYARLGMAGVALLCSTFTLLAFLSIRMLKDPGERTGRGRLYRLAITSISLLLILMLGFPWLLSFLLTKARTRSFEARYSETPKNSGFDYRDVTFISADNVELSGWFLEAPDSTTTFVLTHGLFRSRYEMMQRGLVLRRMGYSVLLYDLRRHGKSRGEFSTMGYNERLDVHAALDYVKQVRPKDSLVAVGVSMGAAATLLAASERDDLEAVIAESSFLSFSETVRHHISLAGIPTVPLAAFLTHFTAFRMNFRLEDFDILAATRRIKAPVMMIGAEKDRRMPVESVLEPLYNAVQNPLKRKLLVKDARHGQAFEKSPVEYMEAIEEFLNTIRK